MQYWRQNLSVKFGKWGRVDEAAVEKLDGLKQRQEENWEQLEKCLLQFHFMQMVATICLRTIVSVDRVPFSGFIFIFWRVSPNIAWSITLVGSSLLPHCSVFI